MKNKRKIKKNVRLTMQFSLIVGMLVVFCCYGEHGVELLECFKELKPSVLLLLIPAVWLTYDAAARIWEPFLQESGLSVNFLARTQYEMRFMDVMMPFLGMVSGVEYARRRLGMFGISPEKVTGLHSYRFVISIFMKWVQITAVLATIGTMPLLRRSILPFVLLWGGVVVIFAMMAIGFGTTVSYLDLPDSQKQAQTWDSWARSETYREILQNTKGFAISLFWAMMHAFMEVTPYLVVATAIGRVDLFWPIMAVSGLGAIVGEVTYMPFGAGTSDAMMALLVWGMGFDLIPTVMILIMSRILMVIGTSVTGFCIWLPSARALPSKR